MAFDEQLADRVRTLLEDEPSVTERRMFGGLAFLVGGKMAVAASGKGGLMVRVDPSEAARLGSQRGVSPVEMRGQTMRGWLRVDSAELKTKRQLSRWIRVGSAAVRGPSA